MMTTIFLYLFSALQTGAYYGLLLRFTHLSRRQRVLFWLGLLGNGLRLCGYLMPHFLPAWMPDPELLGSGANAIVIMGFFLLGPTPSAQGANAPEMPSLNHLLMLLRVGMLFVLIMIVGWSALWLQTKAEDIRIDYSTNRQLTDLRAELRVLSREVARLKMQKDSVNHK